MSESWDIYQGQRADTSWIGEDTKVKVSSRSKTWLHPTDGFWSWNTVTQTNSTVWKLLKLVYFPRFACHLDSFSSISCFTDCVWHLKASRCFNSESNQHRSCFNDNNKHCQRLICCYVLTVQKTCVQNGAVMVASLKQWELQSVSQLARGRRCEANMSLPTATERETVRDEKSGGETDRERGVDRWREKRGRMEKE